MRALVAGAAGFLGSHLCDRLRRDGIEVVGLDNFCTGRRENVKHLEGDPGFSFIEHDITRPLDADMTGPLDVIFNMACPASPREYQRDPLFTLETNYVGTRNLLELAREHGATILQASTSEVYGDPTIHPPVESYWGNVNSFGARACYQEGKRVAETLMLEYARRYGVPIKVVRIFNTYGPRMDPADGRVISSFIVQALRGEAITVFGDGTQSRSFTYVGDVVGALIRLAALPRAIGEVFNIGNTGEVTISDLAARVKEMTGSCSPIHYIPYDQAYEAGFEDMPRRVPDITKIREFVGYEPKMQLDEIIRTVIEYMRAN